MELAAFPTVPAKGAAGLRGVATGKKALQWACWASQRCLLWASVTKLIGSGAVTSGACMGLRAAVVVKLKQTEEGFALLASNIAAIQQDIRDHQFVRLVATRLEGLEAINRPAVFIKAIALPIPKVGHPHFEAVAQKHADILAQPADLRRSASHSGLKR